MEPRYEERLDELLELHRQRRRARREASVDELAAQHAGPFHDAFDAAARRVIVPVLQEFTDALRPEVEAVSLFYQMSAAGLEVELGPYQDHGERRIVFFGDPAAEEVRITHEGTGFSHLSRTLAVGELTPELVEDEMMVFLERLFTESAEGAAPTEPDSPPEDAPPPAEAAEA